MGSQMGYWKKDAQRCPNLERVPWLDHQMWIQSAYFKYAVSYSIQYTAYIQYNYSIYDLGLSETMDYGAPKSTGDHWFIMIFPFKIDKMG